MKVDKMFFWMLDAGCWMLDAGCVGVRLRKVYGSINFMNFKTL